MSRRCLICANINPCRQHSGHDQERELTRNTAEFYRITAERNARALITPTAGNGEAQG